MGIPLQSNLEQLRDLARTLGLACVYIAVPIHSVCMCSEWFIIRVQNGKQTVLWCIEGQPNGANAVLRAHIYIRLTTPTSMPVDPAGKKDILRRNRNASYVAKTHLKG